MLTFGSDDVHAVVPLFRHGWEGRSQLTLIGSGISDWTDPPIETSMSSQVISGIDSYLDRDTNWDVLRWQDLSSDTPLRGLASVTLGEDEQCSEIRLSGGFDGFWSGRSKELRRNVRRYGDRARELGPLNFEVTTDSDSELLNQLIRLHELRWRKLGEPGMIAANNAEAFLRDVVQQFAMQGMLRFFSLRWRTDVVAVILAVVYRNTVFCYMSAFDPEHENLGFGRTLIYEAIRYCFEQRYVAWNFLRGTEAYKASWGAEPVSKICLYRAR